MAKKKRPANHYSWGQAFGDVFKEIGETCTDAVHETVRDLKSETKKTGVAFAEVGREILTGKRR